MADISDSETSTGSDDVLVVDFGLGVVTDTGGQFRFNDEGHFIARDTAVLVRCSVVDIVHGQATSDKDSPCTLIVFAFHLDRKKNTRAIHKATISLTLPEGIKFYKDGYSPHSKISLDPQLQNITKSRGKNLTAGFEYGGKLEGGITGDKEVSMQVTQYATAMGWTTRHPLPRHNDRRPHNCLKWVLCENEARKDGVPPEFQAAVLLDRSDDPDAVFDIKLKINAKADLKTTVEDFTMLLGETPVGSLHIDPDNPSQNESQKYDTFQLAEGISTICKLSYGMLQIEKFSNTK